MGLSPGGAVQVEVAEVAVQVAVAESGPGNETDPESGSTC